jgi:hypothetical protein
LALDPAVVLYGHARGASDASVIRANLALFDEVERRVRVALAAGALSPDADDAELEQVLAYPLERIPGAEVLDDAERTFYADGYRVALRASLHEVRCDPRNRR